MSTKCRKSDNLFQYERNNPKLEYRGFYYNTMLWRPIEPYVIMFQGKINSANAGLMLGHISGVLMAQGVTYTQIRMFLSTVQPFVGEKPTQDRRNIFFVTYLRIDFIDMEIEFADRAKYIQIASYSGSGTAANIFNMTFKDLACGTTILNNNGIKNNGLHRELIVQVSELELKEEVTR